jgi:anti-sigma B factor antagonist
VTASSAPVPGRPAPQDSQQAVLQVVRHGSAHVVQVTGYLDPASARRLEDDLTRLAAAHPPGLDTAVIDLTGADVTAAAAAALMAAARACQDALTLRAAATVPVLQALRLTGLHDHLVIHPSLDDALNSAQPAGPGQLRCTASAWPGYTLVTVTGECDMTTANQLSSAIIDESAQDTPRTIVTLTGLRFLDSAGLIALVRARVRLARQDKGLALVNPGPNVTKILDLTGADTVFRIYPTLAAAIAAG